jgi:hypothetical protein
MRKTIAYRRGGVNPDFPDFPGLDPSAQVAFYLMAWHNVATWKPGQTH